MLAGGTRLAMMDTRRITDVVDVASLGLRGIEARGRRLRIGAATPIQDVIESEEAAKWSLGLLPEACRATSSSLLLRNMSTLGGEIAGADGQSPVGAVLLALGAKVSFTDGSKRILPVADYLSAERSELSVPHIITAIDLPVPHPTLRARLERLAQLPSSLSLALVVVALEVRRGGCFKPRIAVTGATPRPVRRHLAEEVLEGKKLTEENINASAQAAAQDMECVSDHHAGSEYRREMVGVLVRRALGAIAAEGTAGRPRK